MTGCDALLMEIGNGTGRRKKIAGWDGSNILDEPAVLLHSAVSVSQRSGVDRLPWNSFIVFWLTTMLLLVNRKMVAFAATQTSVQAFFFPPWNSWFVCLWLRRLADTQTQRRSLIRVNTAICASLTAWATICTSTWHKGTRVHAGSSSSELLISGVS